MLLAKTVDILEKTFITLSKVGEELSETCKVEYLHNCAATERLNMARAIILEDDEKLNDFVKAKNFLLLNDGRSDAGRKRVRGISAAKQLGQKKLKMVGNKKKVLINDFDPAKDRIPNKEFQALSPGSRKKWNERRVVAHAIGATRTVSFLDDETEAAGFDPELY